MTTFHGLERVKPSHLQLHGKVVSLLASLILPFPCCSNGSLKGSFFRLSHLQKWTYCCRARPPALTDMPHATARILPIVLCPVCDSSVMSVPSLRAVSGVILRYLQCLESSVLLALQGCKSMLGVALRLRQLRRELLVLPLPNGFRLLQESSLQLTFCTAMHGL